MRRSEKRLAKGFSATLGGLAWCAFFFFGMTRDGWKKIRCDAWKVPQLTFATLKEVVRLAKQHHIPIDKQRMKWFGIWRQRTTTSSQSKYTILVDTLMSSYKASGLQRLTRGWRGFNEISYREAPPRGLTPYPYIFHFWQKRYPFWISPIERWHPFNILGREDSNSSNCSKYTVFIKWMDH